MADWLTRNGSMKAAGGTEILLEGLTRHVGIPDHVNLMLSTPDASKVRYTKRNVLWQHLNYSDESLAPMKDPAFMKAIDATVYVSHWQMEKFRYLYQIPLRNAHVIRNAIDPIEYIPRERGEKITLIHTSTPFRGLGVLLDAFARIGREDVELDVYSSTQVYGDGYAAHTGDIYDGLFARCEDMPNVNYMGCVPNEQIHKALQEAHILAYPSIFEETACLALIEAGAAGCQLVTTDLGALPETGSAWASMMTMQATDADMVAAYADHLTAAIDDYWLPATQDRMKRQSDFYNEFYCWDTVAPQWTDLFDSLA